MAEATLRRNIPATTADEKWTAFHTMGAVWLVYWLTNSYVWINDLLPFASYYLLTTIYMLYFFVFKQTQIMGFLSRPIVWVVALTALIPAVMYLVGGSATELRWYSAKMRIIAFSAFAGAGVFLTGPEGPRILQRAAAISFFVAIAANLIDVAAHNPYNSAEGIRSAGFYGDANISAAAIGALLLLTFDVTKQSRNSMLALGMALLAILVTFSRSGIVFGLFLSFAYLIFPRGPGTFSMGARAGIAISGLLTLILVATVATQVLDIDTSAAWRLRSLVTQNFEDHSAQERMERANWALDELLKNFWTGGGLGAANSLLAYSHNSYLEIGIDYGIFGVLTFTLLISLGLFQMLRYGWKRAATAGLLSIQYLFYSNFSHGVPASSCMLVILATFAAGILIKEPETANDNSTLPGGSRRLS